jgi:hypothetical protein
MSTVATTEIASAALVKYVAAAGAATAGVALAAEPMVPIIGVAQSVLLAAIVGTLIGLLILPTAPDPSVPPPLPRREMPTLRRLLQLMLRAGALGALVLAYAIAAAWAVTLAAPALVYYLPSELASAPQLPLAGVSGLLIRRLLPKYLSVVERATDWVGGKRA